MTLSSEDIDIKKILLKYSDKRDLNILHDF